MRYEQKPLHGYGVEEFEKWVVAAFGLSGCMYCRGDESHLMNVTYHQTHGWDAKVPRCIVLGHQLALRVAFLGLHPARVAERVSKVRLHDLVYTEEGGLIAENCVTAEDVIKAVQELLSEADAAPVPFPAST